MKVLVAHPTGNANVRAVVTALENNDFLDRFHTTVAVFSDSRLLTIKEFSRRSYGDEIQPFTKTWPWIEMGRLVANKLGLRSLVQNENSFFSVDAVYRNLDEHVAKQLTHGLDYVYAYEDGALATFERAKQMGISTAYDLPIAYWELGRKLMMEEADRLPSWKQTLGGGIKDSTTKIERKVKELSLADIVCVPSKFVRDSLPDWVNSKRVITSPFGSPANFIDDSDLERRLTMINRPLRVLFVGSMGQRKGLGDLFEAVKKISNKQIELVVMGSLLNSIDFYKKEYADFIYEPVRSHIEVLELMRSCDVFCLPSIVEGRALVIQEAMSQGLPIIITPNTGGEDLVIDGETGFLVPIRSPEKIAEKIAWCIDNREKLVDMGRKSKNHAKSYSWQQYGKLIVDGLLSRI